MISWIFHFDTQILSARNPRWGVSKDSERGKAPSWEFSTPEKQRIGWNRDFPDHGHQQFSIVVYFCIRSLVTTSAPGCSGQTHILEMLSAIESRDVAQYELYYYPSLRGSRRIQSWTGQFWGRRDTGSASPALWFMAQLVLCFDHKYIVRSYVLQRQWDSTCPFRCAQNFLLADR